MGYNTVALLINDQTHAIEQDDFGRRVSRAMHNWLDRDRDPMGVWFGSGAIISQAHADYSQIVVVGQNTGKPIQDCNNLDHYALMQLAEALIRHGWTARPPRKVKGK